MKRKPYKRETYLRGIRPFYHETELIKVLTGIRRCGKSTLLHLIMEELREEGVDEERIVYLNLDRRPYKGIKTVDSLEEEIDARVKDDERTTYLFIDEIQNVKGFEESINAYREEGNFSIFVAGSNSYLLSGELVSKLTGRYIEFPVSTLSFREYVEMKDFYSLPREKDDLSELREYIRYGGFPYSLFLTDEGAKDDYVSSLLDEIMKKDIHGKRRIRDKALFERLFLYVKNNFGATTSLEAICRALTIKNSVPPSRKKVSSYLEVLENAKIIVKCPRFDLKSRRSLSGGEKYYLSDLSLYFYRNPDKRINYGPTLENIVFNYAREQRYSISVGRIRNLEVDFIVSRHDEYAYVQVAMGIYGGEDVNGVSYLEEREYRPLERIKDNYPKYVLSLDTLLQRRNGIKHVNLIDFILKGESFV